jgi:basic amino acid/polyamine antiporter, APA family
MENGYFLLAFLRDKSVIDRLIRFCGLISFSDLEEKKNSSIFTRQSTGLVRQGRWIDSFIFNSSAAWMFGTLIFALSSFVYFGGANLVSAEVIALLFAAAIATMYAILTAVMPRSGGDYIFNSRIVHPAFGFSFNFSLTVWQLFSAAFTLYFISSVALGPGLQVLGYFANAPELFNLGTWLLHPVNSLIFATVVNVLFTFLMLAGIRKTFSALDVIWVLTLLGTFVMIGALVTTTHAGFESAFNSFMVKANSTTVTNSFNFVSNSVSPAPDKLAIPMVAICADSVIWVFWATYIAGEIRHANQVRRNISTMVGAAVLNAVFFVTLVLLLYDRVGIPFLSGITTLANSYSPALPFSSTLQALSAVLVLSTGSFPAAVIVLIAITLGYSVLLLPALYLQPIRSIFAWSFDRVVPLKWSSVSSRFHTPIVSTLGVFAVIEIALFLITLASSSLLGIYSTSVIAPAFSSVFATSLAAILLGFKRNAIPELKQSQRRKLLFTIVGFIALAFIVFMTYEFLSNESFFFPPSSGMSTIILIALNFVFIPIGALIYYISYYVRKQHDRIDLNMIASEIPPE